MISHKTQLCIYDAVEHEVSSLALRRDESDQEARRCFAASMLQRQMYFFIVGATKYEDVTIRLILLHTQLPGR